MPVYRGGGVNGLMELIEKNRPTLPPGAKALFMSFVVDKSGKLTQPRLITVPSSTSIPSSTYQEVARMLTRMNDFVPGQQNGNPVSVSITVPLIPVDR